MKTTNLRQLHLLMNEELLIAVQSTLTKFAFLLSLQGALEGKDELSEEERFSDETYELQDKLYSIYLPFIKEAKNSSKAIDEIARQSNIIPLNLLEDIHLLLQYQEELSSPFFTPFTPYDVTKGKLQESIFDFYLRLVSIYRINSWINDIEMGIQEYGIASYVVQEDDDYDDINILDGVYELSLEALKDEACKLLLVKDDDTDYQQEDKQSLSELCIALEKIGGK